MFGWLRNRRRQKLLAEPFPPWWEAILKRNVGHYALLNESEQKTLKQTTQILVDEKRWEGCNGFQITDEVKVTIAAQAALPLLAYNHEYYDRVKTILVYPSTFRTPNPEDDYEDDELSDEIIAGQAWYRGPVILSWDIVLDEGRNPRGGHNVVIHEFAHQIDFLDYEVDGVPPIDDAKLAERWKHCMTAAYEDHLRLLKAGRETFFTQHAGDDTAEFFADATEAFFCNPIEFSQKFADVYGVFQEYFQLNPIAWFTARHSQQDES